MYDKYKGGHILHWQVSTPLHILGYVLNWNEIEWKDYNVCSQLFQFIQLL